MEPKFNRVIVAGAGGVGFNLVPPLIRALIGSGVSVEVYDADTFEGGNGHLRLPGVVDRSQFKVDALRTYIQFVMGDPPPKVHRKFLTLDDFKEEDWTKTLVLDCTDMDIDKRNELWDSFEQAGAKGIRVSYDGLGIQTISNGPPMMAGNSIDGGYAIIPNMPQSIGAAGLGAQAALFTIFTGEFLSFQVHVPTFETRTIEIRGDKDVL